MKSSVFAVMVFVATPCLLHAQILNGSFETTTSNDSNIPLFWNAEGNLPQIFPSWSTAPYYNNYLSDRTPPYIVRLVDIFPFDGQQFVIIQSDNRGSYCYSKLTQPVTIHAGQSISGAYFFATTDYWSWNDTATITLIDPCSVLPEIPLVSVDVRSVGDHNAMPGWNTFHYDVSGSETGSYVLTIYVVNINDCILSSFFAVDALKSCYPALGDINHDCVVNFFDFALMADQWLNNCNNSDDQNLCNHSDLDHSIVVDFSDLTIMAANWLIDCDIAPEQSACLPP